MDRNATNINSGIWPVFKFQLQMDWSLINKLRIIDRFDAKWNLLEDKEGKSLKELRTLATIRSVGSSTRIEGSRLQDDQVDDLIRSINIAKLVDRDMQEVAGYFEVLDLIVEDHGRIMLTESVLKGLHQQLLRHVEKDSWHRGQYKLLPNSVQAIHADGSQQIIFETAPPGFPTDDAMRALFDWYTSDPETHHIIKVALFTYEFLSIHPFQDGNGRMSRLLSNLLLLQEGYNWIQYVSFEHEIEHRKKDYYRILRECQAQRPHEDVTMWVHFFLDVLVRIQQQLTDKLKRSGVETGLSQRERSILVHVGNNPGITSTQLSKRLRIPAPTIKRLLASLVRQNLIRKSGVGRATSYSQA